MKRLTTNLTLCSLVSAALLGACGKKEDELTCGSGTKESDGECVAISTSSGGMGGDTGDGDTGGSGTGGHGTGGNDSIPEPIGDPTFADISPGRRGDAALTVEEFEGAIAVGSVSRTSALVVWNPASVFDISYNIYVSESEDNFSFGTPQFVAPPGANSFLLTGLSSGKKHYVVIRPVLEGVELPVDDVVVSVTLKKDDEAPSFVGAMDASPADGAAVTLSWDAASDDVSPDEVIIYFVYVAEKGTEIDFRTAYYISDPGQTEVTIRLPRPDTEYDFIVRARDAAGHFDDNDLVVSGTSGPDVVAPVFSGCATAEARNASTVDLTWLPAIDDIARADEIVYNLYASTEPDGHNFSKPSATFTGGTLGFVSGLEAGETYYFVCRAADPSGNGETNTRVQFAETKDDDQPPVFGGIASVENVDADGFELTWVAATDNQSLPEEITYKVYLSETVDGHDFEADAPVVEVVGQTAVAVQDVDSRTTYYVVVLAEDDSGNVSVPSVATVVTTLVSLRGDIEIPIFQNKCATTGCHSGDTPVSGMNLSPGFSFLSIVGVAPTTPIGQESGFKRVEPFFPDQSHLVERINATEIGVRMPLSGDSLSPVEIETIEQWISEGALNN